MGHSEALSKAVISELVKGYRLLVIGYRLLVIGYRLMVNGNSYFSSSFVIPCSVPAWQSDRFGVRKG
jgi:hypothetical protein